MKLFEDYGNLNMIDRSLIDNGKNLKVAVGKIVTPDSRVELVKVKNFTTLMEMFEAEDDLTAVIIRANRRQLLMITKNNGEYSYQWDFVGVLTDWAYNNLEIPNISGQIHRLKTAVQAKTLISRTVKAFYDKFNPEGRKVWDVLKLYKDKEKLDKLHADRMNAKKDSVPNNTKSREYEIYINTLKNNFADRVRKYIESKMPNYENIEQFKKEFLNSPKILQLKYQGHIYNLQDQHIDMTQKPSTTDNMDYNGANDSYLCYTLGDRDRSYPIQRLYVVLGYNGFQPYIYDVYASSDIYASLRTAKAETKRARAESQE